MSDEEIDDVLQQLDNLNSIKTSTKLVIESFKDLLPVNKKNWENHWLKFLIFFLLSGTIAFFVVNSKYTVKKCIEIIETSNNVELALLGIVFTAFAFFQAILSDKVLESLFVAKRNKKSETMSKCGDTLFIEVHKGFYFLIINYVVNVFVNCLLLFFLNSCGNKWVLFLNITLDNFLCWFLVMLYLYITLLVVFEIKYFIFNLFSLFNLSTIIRTVNMIKKNK